MDLARDRAAILSALRKAGDFARRAAADGPEYGDKAAAWAFDEAARAVTSTPPLPGETPEAWCGRVREKAREQLMKSGSPAAFEAVSMIRPSG